MGLEMRRLARVLGPVSWLAACGLPAAIGAAETGAPSLSFPVACEFGKTCFVQSYVDIDPGSEVRDFACGSATYDAHKGTDLRVLSAKEAAAGVAILAAADGTVKGVRDGMPDVFATDENKSAIANRECGNGLVIDHGGGWETQYCHMRQGSVAVKPGSAVQRGDKLGEVGFSGFAAFAHLHFEVRHNSKVIDPFSGQQQNLSCSASGKAAGGLWEPGFAGRFGYVNGEILESDFAGLAPQTGQIEAQGAATPATPESPQLVYFARLINLRAGDRVRIVATGPAGFKVVNDGEPIERNKATYLAFAGKKLTEPRWPAGKYEGVAEVIRDGKVALQLKGNVTID